MAAKSSTKDPAKEQPAAVDISTTALKLKEYITDVENQNTEISVETKNIILVIKYFIDSPSKNEIYRAQTHVANMIDKIEQDSPNDKEVLEKVQVHLDTIYEILEQHEIFTKQQEEAKLKAYINTSIEDGIKNLTIHTPERKFLTTSTPLLPTKQQSSGAISKAFKRQLAFERDFKHLDDDRDDADNFSNGEKHVIDYISRRDFERRLRFIFAMPDEIDHDKFELNKNLPSTDNINTSFYYNEDIYKNSDKDNYKDNDKITYKQMSAPYESDEHHPPNKRASFYYDKDSFKDIYKDTDKHSNLTYKDNIDLSHIKPFNQITHDQTHRSINPYHEKIIQQTRNQENRHIEFPRGLTDAIKTIPEYIGNADMLPVFCKSIRNVRDAFGPQSERWILNALISKLKGPAATGFASRLTQYKDIESLLRDLKTQYWGREGADSLKRKLQTVEQGPTESAASFGLKVQSLHNSLMNALDQDPAISASHRQVLKEIAIKEACEQFLCGLRPELEVATRAKQPTVLSAAIDAAVAHESNRGIRDTVKLTSSQTIPSEANIKLTTTENIENPSQIVNSKNITSCNFCKKPGHELLECRTLRRKIMNEGYNSNNFSSSKFQNQPFRNRNFNTQTGNYDTNNFKSSLRSSIRNNMQPFNNRNNQTRRVRFYDERPQYSNNNRSNSPIQQPNNPRQFNNSRQFYNTDQFNNHDYNNYNRNNTRQNFYDNNDKRPNIRRNFELQRTRSYNDSNFSPSEFNRSPRRNFYNNNDNYNQHTLENNDNRTFNNLAQRRNTSYNNNVIEQQNSNDFTRPSSPRPTAPLNFQ